MKAVERRERGREEEGGGERMREEGEEEDAKCERLPFWRSLRLGQPQGRVVVGMRRHGDAACAYVASAIARGMSAA